MALTSTSKDVGVNTLPPLMAESSEKPLSVAQTKFLELGGATDSKGKFLCPKDEKKVKSMRLVKREGKYKTWYYLEIRHWNSRNKNKKVSYCYIRVKA